MPDPSQNPPIDDPNRAPESEYVTRRAGQSLAGFPAAVLTLLPYPIQRQLPSGSMLRRVLRLAWPSVLEQSLVTLVGLVDGYIVGHLGVAAIAGVGLGGQVLHLAAALFAAIGVGATALVARHVGAREPEGAQATARHAVAAAGVIGAVTALAGFAFSTPIIAAFGGEPDVVREGAQWLRIVAPSFLPLAILLVGGAALRGAGDMRGPLVAMIAVNIVNVVLAWTLTHGSFGLPSLGLRGTAIGALAGHTVGSGVILWLLVRRRGVLRLGAGRFQWDPARLRRILNIGLPSGAEQVMLQLALSSLAVLITSLGTQAYAAHTIGLRIAALSFLPGWGFSVAATTLVGQELGAGRPDRARASAMAAYAFGLAVMSIMGAFLFAFEEPILRLFTDDPEVIRHGTVVLRASASFQPIIATSFVFGGALRGAGDTRSAMVVTVISIWGLRLLLSYLFAVVLGLGLLGAWLAIGADFLFRATLFVARFRGGKWALVTV